MQIGLEFLLRFSLPIARPLSWLIVATFLAAGLLERRDRERARAVAVVAWGLFGLFWLVLVPHFILEQKSIVEGIGSVAAVPLSLYAGYLLWHGRDSLFVLSRAVGLMGLVYLPFSYLPFLESNVARQWLVEVVTDHTAMLMSAVGFEPTVVEGMSFTIDEAAASQYGHQAGTYEIPAKDYPYDSTFLFLDNTAPITYTILVACTGIGSMAMMAGGILAVAAPLRRKARALALSLSVIYVLNLGRNVFIGVSFGHQRMQWFVEPMMSLFGTEDPQMVSYYFADRLLAQFGSVVAMVLIIWLVVRELPEIMVVVEDLLFLVTGTEYELQESLAPETVRADGGGED